VAMPRSAWHFVRDFRVARGLAVAGGMIRDSSNKFEG